MVDTLSNGRTNICEAPSSLCIGVTSSALPEARTAQIQQGSNTGVSLDYAHDPNKKWFVIRATYGREQKAYDIFSAQGMYAFIPRQSENNEGKEVSAQKEKSLIPGIVFVYCKKSEIERFTKGENRISYLHYYYDRTRKNAQGRNNPLIIQTPDMDNFIHALATDGTKQVAQEYISFKTGDKVIVTDGVCKGLTGKVGRVSRQTGVIIELEGLCCLMTTYVPKAFIQEVERIPKY